MEKELNQPPTRHWAKHKHTELFLSQLFFCFRVDERLCRCTHKTLNGKWWNVRRNWERGELGFLCVCMYIRVLVSFQQPSEHRPQGPSSTFLKKPYLCWQLCSVVMSFLFSPLLSISSFTCTENAGSGKIIYHLLSSVAPPSDQINRRMYLVYKLANRWRSIRKFKNIIFFIFKRENPTANRLFKQVYLIFFPFSLSSYYNQLCR